MIDTVDDATARRAMLYGLRQIVRYNWPQYATSVAVIAGAVAALYLNDWPRPMRWILAALIGLAGWWTLASLAVSHWVYDRADVADGRRIIHLVPAAPRRWALIHVGVDDTSPAIRTALPASRGCVLDVYDPDRMTEPSIARARRTRPAATGTVRATFDRLPLEDASCDAVFLVFAAHEFRARADRERLFGEVRRILAAGGRLLLVEHVRDAANFVAFGPGFLHFLGAGEWRSVARHAGLAADRSLRRTPFVRAFVFRRPS